MTSIKAFFSGKNVTLMGLGLLGRGVGDAAFLARHCKHVTVTDMKSAEELRPSLDALRQYGNIDFVLGRHDEKDFTSPDFIVKGAGIRLDNPMIAAAKAKNIPVYMSTALFAHLSPLRTVGVTGTRGKTTTTCMIAEILKRAGEKVLVGGNIRGVSTLAFLDSPESFDCAVLELDSWQMQGFDTLGISPNVAVFTSFTPDHMNYYDGDMGRYLRDKASIFLHQKQNDVFIAPRRVIDILRDAGFAVPPDTVEAPTLPDHAALSIPGAHNRMNAGLALQAAKAMGIDEATALAALAAFQGVEGRLHYVGSGKGRVFYNDSNATTQEATLAALAAFPYDKTVLIFGGSDKGLPIDKLAQTIKDNHVRCVLIKGTGSDRVLKLLPELEPVGSMPDAMAAAMRLSRDGDTIVLSPSFASFGVFKNEYDRSDQYLNAVQALIEQEA